MSTQAGFSVDIQCNSLSVLIWEENLVTQRQTRKGSNIESPDKKEKPRN